MEREKDFLGVFSDPNGSFQPFTQRPSFFHQHSVRMKQSSISITQPKDMVMVARESTSISKWKILGAVRLFVTDDDIDW